VGLREFLTAKLRTKQALPQSVYDFKLKTLAGEVVDFEKFRGKQLLIVNTASKCGFTPQYADLQKLHETYGDTVVVLGFPANNFMWQEPGSNKDIAQFCSLTYGVTFPMFEKISVKGSNQHPLYTWLQMKTGKVPTWNFSKYLVDEQGYSVTFFRHDIKPLDARIVEKIKNGK
jgi:glutathione peroxidase